MSPTDATTTVPAGGLTAPGSAVEVRRQGSDRLSPDRADQLARTTTGLLDAAS